MHHSLPIKLCRTVQLTQVHSLAAKHGWEHSSQFEKAVYEQFKTNMAGSTMLSVKRLFISSFTKTWLGASMLSVKRLYMSSLKQTWLGASMLSVKRLYMSSLKQTWLGASMLSVKRLYMSSLKQLLGLRNATSNDLALTETGLSDLKSMVDEKQMFLCRC